MPLRIAHITDIHIQPELGAAEGLAACLKQIQSLHGRPDFILNGGDSIMDSLEASKERVAEQWDLFSKVMRDNLELPIEHVIGNHDVWGWHRRDQYESDPLFGKAWALQELGLQRSYRSFDRGGWHFIVLDSTFPLPVQGYTARLDEGQFSWLVADLAATDASTPILIVSHIPILAVCPFLDGENEASGNWQVPGAWMHIDARRIKDLFARHPNVRLCVSGHIHLSDQVVYNGVTYCCNGAVCGGWWKGSYQECPPGYALIDLFEDGSFGNEYVSYS